jgi:BirA family biotin operon repressor/biotin-[acetyl-CoA-carboxylase] ligase
MTPRRTLGTPLIRMGEVTSTMDIARRLETLGAPEGTTIVASSQTHGRGRSDRAWQSPAGAGLYCSILLRPELPAERFQPFSIAVGLAICEALDPGYRIGFQLKWPNDVLYQGRKLGGILITTALSGPTVTSAVVGFGLNLRLDPSHPGTSIALESVTGIAPKVHTGLEHRILCAISVRYDQLASGEGSSVADWPSRLAYVGDQVIIQDGSSTISGTLHRLDLDGALILHTPAGEHRIAAGQLTRGPRLTS